MSRTEAIQAEVMNRNTAYQQWAFVYDGVKSLLGKEGRLFFGERLNYPLPQFGTISLYGNPNHRVDSISINDNERGVGLIPPENHYLSNEHDTSSVGATYEYSLDGRGALVGGYTRQITTGVVTEYACSFGPTGQNAVVKRCKQSEALEKSPYSTKVNIPEYEHVFKDQERAAELILKLAMKRIERNATKD